MSGRRVYSHEREEARAHTVPVSEGESSSRTQQESRGRRVRLTKRVPPPDARQSGEHTRSWRPRPADYLRKPAVRLSIMVCCALACVAVFFLAGLDLGNLNVLVLRMRATRVAALVLVGVAVSISTVAFQTIAENRILTPSIMGFDALYAVVQTTIIFLFGTAYAQHVGVLAQFALSGGIMVVFAVVLFTSMMRRPIQLMILIGIVLGTMLRSVSTLLQSIMEPNSLTVLQAQLFASFGSVDSRLLGVSTMIICALGCDLLRRSRVLDVLSLGREHAISLGVPYRRALFGILVDVAVLVATSTALVGPVTFFGLLVSALAYRLAGSARHIWVLPAAACIAVICLVGGQAILEFALGMNGVLSGVIEFVGGIVFILLILSHRKRLS